MSARTPRTLLSLAALAAALVVATGCEPLPSDQQQDPGGSAAGENAAATAKDRLDKLIVAKAGSMSGYKRDRFPHWRSTGENCDVRDTVLKRDGTKVKVSGCNVVAGSWRSVYDGTVLNSPTKVDIDHVVPLANAWRSGARAWTDDKRGDFANDVDRPQLIASSQNANRSKGDQDPSTWKPKTTSTWCEYAEDWIEVKSYWKLSVTTAEKTALTDMLKEC